MRDLAALIGHTPLVRLNSLQAPATMLVKVEGMNPGGSAKDRVALSMVADAEARACSAPAEPSPAWGAISGSRIPPSAL